MADGYISWIRTVARALRFYDGPRGEAASRALFTCRIKGLPNINLGLDKITWC